MKIECMLKHDLNSALHRSENCSCISGVQWSSAAKTCPRSIPGHDTEDGILSGRCSAEEKSMKPEIECVPYFLQTEHLECAVKFLLTPQIARGC